MSNKSNPTHSKLSKPESSTNDANYLIIGQGDIGLPVTNQLADQGYRVTGLARGVREDYELHNKADFMQADATTLTAKKINDFTHIAIVVTPDTYDVEAYKNTYYKIAQHLSSLQGELSNLQRIVFISSTGVYGQDNGEWIDDTIVPTKPKREASAYILKAEQVLQQTFDKQAIIIRPSGIYGKDRLMRIRKAQESDKAPILQYAWTNRIMDSDLVTIISKVLTLDVDQENNGLYLKPVYLATDYAPVTSNELMQWLTQRLDAEPPSIKEGQDQVTGKRLHSNIPRDWLQYPDWRAGYSMILENMSKGNEFNRN